MEVDLHVGLAGHDEEPKMITLTDSAVNAINRFIRHADKPLAGLRIRVEGGGCSGFKYGLKLEDTLTGHDLSVSCQGITLLVDESSASLLQGVTVDFVETMESSGFTFSNPNASHSCACGKSFAC